MTPDEIIETFVLEAILHSNPAAKSNAIIRMQQYAREKCIEQRHKCFAESGLSLNSKGGKAIINTKYPKDL